LDPALVRRAQRGDVEAFTELIAERIEPMARTAMAIIGREPDARDAVQEALASIWRSLPRLRDPARFDAWSTRILVHASRRIAGRRNVRGLRELALDLERDDKSGDARFHTAISPEGEAITRDALERAFDRLDADARSLLVLHHLDNRSIEEIAQILVVPAGTVKSRLSKARADLGGALELENR
jgi:RNA polymerase sigma-70 factor (ECF subfamily)